LEHGITTVYPAWEEKAAGARSGTRTASASSARRRLKTSWPSGWRRSPSG
jgi:hypothetical protein